MGFKSRADQISHTLPTTRHRCKLEVRVLVQDHGDTCEPLTRDSRKGIEEYYKDMFF